MYEIFTLVNYEWRNLISPLVLRLSIQLFQNLQIRKYSLESVKFVPSLIKNRGV